MAECGVDSVTASKETESITQLREKLRTKMRISRQEHRHESVDTIRMAIGENYTENLRTYTPTDVLKLAKAVKHQKRAKLHQLGQLSHAFLQSAENIQCFLNVTGALNVIVKEFTGNHEDTQLLAAECLCNLSLGAEISCEKLALHIGSYLITYLKSSNERLLRTCLWTITNLIASGDKALKVLVDQEVTKSLSSVKTNALNDCIKEDALIAIDVALDSNVLRQEDIFFLLDGIPDKPLSAILDFITTKILYKLLNRLSFQWADGSVNPLVKVMTLSIATVFHLYRSFQPSSTECSEQFSHIIILLRIIGNLLATNEWAVDHMVTHGFAANNVEVARFFKNLLETMDNEASQLEILWVARNLLENRFLHADCLAYVKRGGLDMNMLIEFWRQLSNVRI